MQRHVPEHRQYKTMSFSKSVLPVNTGFLGSQNENAPVGSVMLFCLGTVSGLATVGLVSCLFKQKGFSGLLLFHNDTEPTLTRVYGGRPVLLTSFS